MFVCGCGCVSLRLSVCVDMRASMSVCGGLFGSALGQLREETERGIHIYTHIHILEILIPLFREQPDV